MDALPRAWTNGRRRIIAPATVALVALLWVGGFPHWRIAAMVGVRLLRPLVFALFLRKRSAATRVFAGWYALLLTQVTIVGLTGGLASPLLSQLIGPTVGSLVTFGGNRRSLGLLAVSATGAMAFLLVPRAWLGPSLPPTIFAITCALSLLVTLLMAWNGVTSMADAHRRAEDSLERMRDARLQDAAERVRSLEAIGGRVGHELKNPLTAIKGLVHLVARQAVDERARARFDVITGEVARMEAILRGYLSFSRPLDDLELRPVRLRALVADVLSVLEGRAAGARVALRVEGDDLEFEADLSRLRDALLSLVANGVEATPPGGAVRITLASDGADVIIGIEDGGAGVSPEILSRMGTPFFTTRAGGTGLGIVLARNVVIHHGGRLDYESQPGRGMIARVRLPRVVPETLRRAARQHAS